MKKLLLTLALTLFASNAMAADTNFRPANKFIIISTLYPEQREILVNTDQISHIHEDGLVFLTSGVRFNVKDKTLAEIRTLLYTQQPISE